MLPPALRVMVAAPAPHLPLSPHLRHALSRLCLLQKSLLEEEQLECLFEVRKLKLCEAVLTFQFGLATASEDEKQEWMENIIRAGDQICADSDDGNKLLAYLAHERKQWMASVTTNVCKKGPTKPVMKPDVPVMEVVKPVMEVVVKPVVDLVVGEVEKRDVREVVREVEDIPFTMVRLESPTERKPKRKGFPCLVPGCGGKELSTRYSLKRHLENVHGGLKPYVCDWKFEDGQKCGKSFAQKATRKRHYQCHTGGYGYSNQTGLFALSKKALIPGRCQLAFTEKDHLTSQPLIMG